MYHHCSVIFCCCWSVIMLWRRDGDAGPLRTVLVGRAQEREWLNHCSLINIRPWTQIASRTGNNWIFSLSLKWASLEDGNQPRLLAHKTATCKPMAVNTYCTCMYSNTICYSHWERSQTLNVINNDISMHQPSHQIEHGRSQVFVHVNVCTLPVILRHTHCMCCHQAEGDRETNILQIRTLLIRLW